MSIPPRSAIEPLAGYRSQEVALFIAQLDDQSRRLHEATRDLTPDELQWQPKPGTNSIGMLLAHLAIVEAWWTGIVVKGVEKHDIKPVLGIGEDDDGMPIPEDAKPPANLAGKDLAFFDDLLARGRRYIKGATTDLPDSDLTREFTRTRPDGSKRIYTVRWYLYHVLEHFAGHHGQILLLRHLYKIAHVPAKA